MEGYRVLDLVGEGSFGKVYKARKKHSAQVSAMKFITKKGKSEKDVDGLRQEIEILRNLKHENIIGMLDAFETSSEFCVVTEFAHGELFDVLQHDRRLSEDQVRKIARQLVKALHYLHSRRIIHRDMKPQNILIGTGGLVKLCDFGFASAMSPSTLMLHSIKGTPLYMAPELVQEQAYNHNVDLWSLGVILYELYFGVPPFYTNSIYKLINQIVKSPVEFQQPISSEFENFLSGLLHKVPGERLSWPELLHHPFVQETEQEKLVVSSNPSISLGSNDRDALQGQNFVAQDCASCSPPVEKSSACHTAAQSGLNSSSNQQPHSVHMDSNSQRNSSNTLKEKNGDGSNACAIEKKPEVVLASESLDSYSGQGVTSGDLSGSERQTCSRMSACSSEVATSDRSNFQDIQNHVSPSGLEGLGSWLACVMDGCKAELEIPAMGSVLPKVKEALACIQEHSEIDLTGLILALLDLVCTLSYSDEVSGSRVRTVRFALGSLVCLLDNSWKETMETFVYGEAGNRLLLMSAGTAKKLRSRSASPSDGATASLNSVLRTAASLLMRLSVESQDLVGQMASPDSPAANPDHARSLLHGSNSPQVLGDILLVYSQLARMDAAVASIFSEDDLPLCLHGLLCHRSPIVRGRAAHLIGNLCRHSPLYYQQLVRPFARSGHGTGLQAGATREQSKEKPVGYRSEPSTLMGILIELLRDEDVATRKFASFALGNAAFHNQTLYMNLTDAIVPLIDLLLRDDADKESGKVRANAAGALGNFVRNGTFLCDRLVTSGALDALNAVAFRDGDCAAPVALFSLGNMAAYEVCRYKMHSLEIDKKAAVLSRTGQGNIAKYAARILSKYTGRSKR